MPHGDAVDLKRLAALGKNLSEMPPRRPLSSAILHFLWQDLRGNSQARNAGSQFNAQDNQEQGTREAVRGLEVTKRPNRQRAPPALPPR